MTLILLFITIWKNRNPDFAEDTKRITKETLLAIIENTITSEKLESVFPSWHEVIQEHNLFPAFNSKLNFCKQGNGYVTFVTRRISQGRIFEWKVL